MLSVCFLSISLKKKKGTCLRLAHFSQEEYLLMKNEVCNTSSTQVFRRILG